ncbi:MAG: TrmH family RNA methyltransferase [Flavonifractor plautii]
MPPRRCAPPWGPASACRCGGDAGGADRPAGPVGRPLHATALRDDTEDIRSVPLGSAAVVIGSEGRGVSQPVLDACRATLKIPMRDRCESLNAAVAASVVLWEGWR